MAGALLFGTVLGEAAPAMAQVRASILLDPHPPTDFRAYQEIAVDQLPQDDWDALGIRVSSFTVYPQIGFGQSFTDNAYTSEANKLAAAVETFAPKVEARSQWSRHSLRLLGQGTFDRYVGETARNQDTWTLAANGSLDVTRRFQLTAGVQASQLALNRFVNDEIDTGVAILQTRQDRLTASAIYKAGLSRTEITLERYDIRYLPSLLDSGSLVDQSDRNHHVNRVTGQFEYNFTPNVTLYSQGIYSDFIYKPNETPRIETTSSQGARFIVGGRVAFPGLGRATVSAAYGIRTYDLAGLKSAKGPSFEGRFEFFLSALTTVTVEGGRRQADTQLVSSAVSRSNYGRVHVDHALLRNLTLSFEGSATRRSFIGTDRRDDLQFASLSAVYLSSRRFELRGVVSYSHRHSTPDSANSDVSELQGGVTATVKL